MHNSYYFLMRWVALHHSKLIGATVKECFSQNSDEFICVLQANQEFFLKAFISNELSYVALKDDFSKAKRDVRPWFRELNGLKVKTLKVFSNERAFYLGFNNSNYRLVFKMFGNRANVVLFDVDESVKGLFNRRLKVDYELPYDLTRALDLSYASFLSLGPRKFLPTLDKVVWRFLEDNGFAELSAARQHETLIQLTEMLLNGLIYINIVAEKPSMALVDTGGEVKWEGFDPEEAIQELEKCFFSDFALKLERNKLLVVQEKKQKKLIRDQKKLNLKLNQIDTDGNKRELADVIMANLHVLKPGLDTSVFDFYQGITKSILIPQNETPQGVAQKLYRKHKNQHIEISNLNELLLSKAKEIDDVLVKKQVIQEIDNWKSLRKLRVIHAPIKKLKPVMKFKEFEFFGYKIFVGRNSKNNDELTLKFAKKNDLWLHAKDVAGSHVVIKKKGDATVPKNVIEYAARLAGKYSKRKNDSLCPVTVTPKKFVRKVKGAPAGAVVVEREEVLLVRLN